MTPVAQLIDVSVAKGYVQSFIADPILKMAANAVLDNAPRVDAVEVVRCKQCECNGRCSVQEFGNFGELGFCSHGKGVNTDDEM